MIRVDNFYFVVNDLKKSICFYSELLGEQPTNFNERWADWGNGGEGIYFGIISKDATGYERIVGNNGVLGLYTEDIQSAYKKCLENNVKILYDIEEIPNSNDGYKCFAIEDLDGNKIEIAFYKK